MKKILILSILILIVITGLNSCDKFWEFEKIPHLKVPVLSTTKASSITTATAIGGGDITSDAGYDVTARGVCWGLSENPIVETASKTSDGTGKGIFASNLKGLLPNTTYYVRAYATNSRGTAYGIQETFKTLPLTIPTLSGTVSNIGQFTATVTVSISYDGGTSVTANGACWSTSENPTNALTTKTIESLGKQSFTTIITGLAVNTTYYVRAYAVNKVGVAYGTQISFKTNPAILPTLTTLATSGITQNNAISGGNISSDGGALITSRGVCWSTNQNPAIDLITKTTNGTGPGTYTSNIVGLTANTTYYVRAYATNSVGTSYGSQISLKTNTAVVPTLTTTSASNITQNSALSGGNISSDGGAAITSRGICWSTSQNPTIALSTKISDNSGTATFTSNITGLTANTTYYVRAYATNIVGTSYGSQVSFNTLFNYGTMTDIDGNVYKTITIGTQTWMAENLKTTKYRNGNLIPNVTANASWAALATGAYCWYNNDATTYKAAYGALYNWYAVADSRNIAPTGWHVPTDAEWTTLTNFLGGETVSGGKLKETGTQHWSSPNTGATNSSGFIALPSGYRYYNGAFYNIGYDGDFWSSSAYTTTNALYRDLYYFYANVTRSNINKQSGLSVRCVHD